MGDKSFNEFKEAMDTIKARGIVKTTTLNSGAIYRFDFDTGKFNPYDKNKLFRLFNRLYLNSYDVNYGINTIINDLPAINISQLDNYYRYADALSKNIDFEDLQIQVKELLEANNLNKKSFTPIQWKLSSQLQHLINNDVFTNGYALYQYNQEAKRFEEINPKHLIRLYKGQSNLDCLSAIGLQHNIGFFIANLINASELIGKFNEYYNTQNILNNCKNDYDAIADVIANFD